MPRKYTKKKGRKNKTKVKRGGTLTNEEKDLLTLYHIRKPDIKKMIASFPFIDFLKDKIDLVPYQREYNDFIARQVLDGKDVPEENVDELIKYIKHEIDPEIEERPDEAINSNEEFYDIFHEIDPEPIPTNEEFIDALMSDPEFIKLGEHNIMSIDWPNGKIVKKLLETNPNWDISQPRFYSMMRKILFYGGPRKMNDHIRSRISYEEYDQYLADKMFKDKVGTDSQRSQFGIKPIRELLEASRFSKTPTFDMNAYSDLIKQKEISIPPKPKWDNSSWRWNK
jgi:hypothetical protein